MLKFYSAERSRAARHYTGSRTNTTPAAVGSVKHRDRFSFVAFLRLFFSLFLLAVRANTLTALASPKKVRGGAAETRTHCRERPECACGSSPNRLTKNAPNAITQKYIKMCFAPARRRQIVLRRERLGNGDANTSTSLAAAMAKSFLFGCERCERAEAKKEWRTAALVCVRCFGERARHADRRHAQRCFTHRSERANYPMPTQTHAAPRTQPATGKES